MSLSPELDAFAPALLDSPLRGNPLISGHRADPRLVDPRLSGLIDEALSEARERGHAEGYRVGYAEGLVAAEREIREQFQQHEERALRAVQMEHEALQVLTVALRDALANFETSAVVAYDETAESLGPVVMTLVEALLGREPTEGPEAAIDSIRRALRQMPSGSAVTVHLNNRDAAAISASAIDLGALLERQVIVRADATIPSGSARVDSGARQVDAHLASAIDRLRQVMGS
jgi:flagellar biosynthesis/type III secretory pathway protein FliH